jgi:hypothetical protein
MRNCNRTAIGTALQTATALRFALQPHHCNRSAERLRFALQCTAAPLRGGPLSVQLQGSALTAVSLVSRGSRWGGCSPSGNALPNKIPPALAAPLSAARGTRNPVRPPNAMSDKA